MAPLRVHVLHGTYGDGFPYGCTYVRLLLPLAHPSVADRVALTHGSDARIPPCDVLVVERHVLWPESEQRERLAAVFDACRGRGTKVVYTLDDNLLDLNRERPWRFPTETMRGVIRFLARTADAVVVSTPALAERFAHLNSRVHVIPNALDERLFGAPPEPAPARRPLTVGFMGTLTHEADLMMVLRPLRGLLKRAHGGIRLEVVGGVDGGRFKEALGGLPVKMIETGDTHEYPKFVGWMREHVRWDFAIAPLEDDPFTRCKSDLKYLDYGALAIPAVFSDVRPYRETVRNRETGLVVPNDPDAWAAALEEMARDEALRSRLARAARDEVHATRMLATNAVRWLEALS
ncbi:MAG: glycosyltransferase family 4 protein [Holophagales bacterium]|nr:glycosyltransferase family 4 protein [Holophagales bacterium]